jgi:mono/diheme cytochrome c family protein
LPQTDTFRPRRRSCLGLGALSGAFVLGLMVTVTAQLGLNATAPRPGGNPEAAKIKNPVPSSPDSIASGKASYQFLCARCHGRSGKGDGPTTLHGEQPSDFTDATWDYGSSDGEIFTVIRDGTSVDSQSFSDRLSETEMWNLVNYIRTLGPPAKP